MNKQLLLIGLLIMVLVLVGCGDTGDTANQTTSAQSLQPAFTGYSVQSADSVIDSFTAAVGAGALSTGNIPLAATLERVNTTLDCLEDAGAVSGNIYVQTENVQVVPQAGVSIVINVSRIERNVLGCLTETPFSAQSVLEIEPCADAGSFIFSGEEFVFAYIGAGDQLCTALATHYSNLTADS